MTIEHLASYFYPGTLIEVAGVGVPGPDNPTVYCGSIDEIPAEMKSYRVAFIAASGSDAYTLRIECDNLKSE